MSAIALEKTHIPPLDSPLPKIRYIRYELKKTQKKERPGWIPSEITENWDTDPYAYQTEEEQMPQGGPHGQLSSYLSELLRSYLEPKDLMLLTDSLMLYRDKSGIPQRVGPDLLLMPLQKPAPTSYDLDIEPPPSLLVEITSPNSHEKDLDENVSLYASLDIMTYLVIDLMVPKKEEVREQIQLHVFKNVSGQFVEQSFDPKGYLTLPEMGLKINAVGQEIRLVDQLTGEVLLDATELKAALETEVENAKEAKRQALYEKQRADAEAKRANAAEQRAQAEAQRANVAEQRAQAEAQRAKAAEQRAQIALKEGEQKGRLTEKQEIARNLLAEGLSLTIVAKTTGLSIDELSTLK
jgi:colicin import membrane protein